MATKCYNCGKPLGFFSKKYEYEVDSKTVWLCDECDKKFQEKEEKRKRRKEAERKRKELKKPAEPELSEDGWPLCPICGKEFKSKEEIIKHLIKNQKEFKELSIMSVVDNGVYSTMEGNGWPIEKALPYQRWLREVKDNKYSKWKEELKPKKVKRRESPISPRLRFEILKRDNFTCQYCGRKAPEVELEVDHIEPYSKTKDNSPENLITACKECNRGKRAKDVLSKKS